MNPKLWYVDGILPSYGSINILGGNTHAGKSTLLYSMARSLRYGEPFLNRLVTQPPYIAVIMADRPTEDNPMWVRALQDELIDGYVSSIEDKQFLESTRILTKQKKGMHGVEKLEFFIDKLDRQEDMVLVVDVFTTGFVGNVQSINETKDMMDMLNGLCHSKNICLIGTGYGVKPVQDKKQRYERYIDRLIGASPLRGGASTLMYLATKEEATGDGYGSQVFEAVPRNGPPVRLGVEMGEDRIFREVPLVRIDTQAVQELPIPSYYNALPFVPIVAANWKEIYGAYTEAVEEPVSESRFRWFLRELAREGEIENPERGAYRALAHPAN